MSSSGSGFQVDPQTLGNLATVLVSLGSELNTIHDGRGQLPYAIQANEVAVGEFSTWSFDNAGNALQNFAGDWSNGINRLNQESSNLASILQDAANAYASTEAQLAKSVAPKT